MNGGKRGWEGKQLMKILKEEDKIMKVTGHSSVSNATELYSHTQPPSGWPRKVYTAHKALHKACIK